VTNFAKALRTADTLIEVGRFLYEARTASRRSAENTEPSAEPPPARTDPPPTPAPRPTHGPDPVQDMISRIRLR